MHLLSSTRHRTASYALLLDAEGKTITEHDLTQCCHCGLHFRIRPGSGIMRGWCCKCAQPTCGKLACQGCLPWEKRLEQEEKIARVLQSIRGW